MRKNETNISKILRLAGILLAAVIIIAVIIVAVKKSRHENPYDENRKKVAALESADISHTEKALKELEKNSKKPGADGEEVTPETLVVRDDIAIKQAFQDNVIIGDSFCESIVGYGYLDEDVVVYKRGMSIGQADELIEKAIALHPQNIFLAFGANDLQVYNGDAEIFGKAYREKIDMIQKALPDTPVFINCILPIQDSAIAEDANLAKYPEFNEMLKTVCEEKNCRFIDSSFIVEGHDEMYEPDGEHVISEYYPKWLSYLADIAGI